MVENDMELDFSDNEQVEESGRNFPVHGFQTFPNNMIWCTAESYDDDGCPHGLGIMKYEDSTIYEGDISHGLMHGVGRVTRFGDNPWTYTGQFYDNMPHGEGEVVDSHGRKTFSTSWVNGMVEGLVVDYFPVSERPFCLSAVAHIHSIMSGGFRQGDPVAFIDDNHNIVNRILYFALYDDETSESRIRFHE